MKLLKDSPQRKTNTAQLPAVRNIFFGQFCFPLALSGGPKGGRFWMLLEIARSPSSLPSNRVDEPKTLLQLVIISGYVM